LHIIHIKLVGSPSGRGIPQAVTEIQPLAIFREFNCLCHRQSDGIIRSESIEILIQQSVQACAIAAAFTRIQPFREHEIRARRAQDGCEGEYPDCTDE
jgi:hypothetical protein